MKLPILLNDIPSTAFMGFHECVIHPRWTYGCNCCDEVERNRRLLRISSGVCSAGDELWIVDPNLT